MDGSILGNVVGVIYWLLFMVGGIWMGQKLFFRESMGVRILTGSVIGSFLLQWLPVLCSFILGFGRESHLAAVGILLLLFGIGWWQCGRRGHCEQKNSNQRNQKQKVRGQRQRIDRADLCFLAGAVVLLVFFLLLLRSHTLLPDEAGNYYTGQATYGDMNMHLAFITSIARQGTFPPEYSILPGNRICYPFLCDSISSSIYLWGSSLRLAYILPMAVAFMQVMSGIYLLAKYLLGDGRKAVVTWILFFFNGGLGILYFLGKGSDNFQRIFTEFYQTPTNYVDENVRWANTLVDMLLPQRATLFGWAVLFPVVLLVAKGIRDRQKCYLVLSGILVGGLPMIHTHSFVAMAFIGAVWLLGSVWANCRPEWMNQRSVSGKYLFLGVFVLFNVISLLTEYGDTEISEKIYYGMAISAGGLMVLLCLWTAWKGWHHKEGKQCLILWGIFLGMVLLLALPQLFQWTFRQAQGNQFLRGGFNWSNEGDQYLIFYLKNIGIALIFIVIGILKSSRRQLFIIGPGLFIWLIAELVLFQPNPYDNNKLLYVAYFFLLMPAASLAVDWYERVKNKPLRIGLTGVFFFLTMISAVLTMGREWISEYMLYPADEVKMCHYIEENVDSEDVILTDTRHNNAISSLTGTNIVCGSSSILYYHGLPYQKAEQAVSMMYQDPSQQWLFDQYGVDYVLVGPSERYSYVITDESAFEQQFTLIHQEGEYHLYARK